MRKAVALGLALVTSACQSKPPSPGPRSQPLKPSWSRLRSVVIEGSARYWEPEQSEVADGESRFIGTASFRLVQDVSEGSTSIEWHRQTEYPFRRSYDYRERVHDARGSLLGGDSWSVPKDSPIIRALSSDHLANEQRELAVLSPWSLNQRPVSTFFEPTIDPQSGLFVHLHARDFDTAEGDSNYDIALTDVREESGLKVAHRLVFSLNGQRVREMTLDRVAFDGAPAPAVPEDLLPLASDVAPGGTPYQWVSRRVPMGGYTEAESTSKMRLEEIAPGVELVAGRSHNALVVEQAKSLLVVDAPLDEAYTSWVIAACRARFPEKPITTLVLTHHHNDHTGGARGYVAVGARVIVGVPNRAHFERVFQAPHRLDNDALQQAARPAVVVEVEKDYEVPDPNDPVHLYRIENTHAQGMLFVFLPARQLGFVADLWSPARDKFGSALTFDRHGELVTALTRLKLHPERIAGGHGEVGSYAELQAEITRGVQDE